MPLEKLDVKRAQPILIFPYDLMGSLGIRAGFLIGRKGNFGPFAGQMFVGDVTQSSIMRATVEKVDGELQGACYPFKRGFESGNNRAVFEPDGALWVGETARGWGSISGGKAGGLQAAGLDGRKCRFEIQNMELTPDGFVLTFTKAVGLDRRSRGGDISISALLRQSYDRRIFCTDHGEPAGQRDVVERGFGGWKKGDT